MFKAAHAKGRPQMLEIRAKRPSLAKRSMIPFLLVSYFLLLAPVSLAIPLGVRAQTKVPIPSALVAAFSEEGSGYAVTNAQGGYLISEGLTAGIYNVTVLAEGYLSAEIGNIEVTAGVESQNVDFFLKLSSIVSGKVSDSISAQPLQKIVVIAVPLDAEGAYIWQGVTDTEGKYRITTNLATGKYNITALFPEGHMTKTSGPVSLTAGIETKDVNLVLERSGIISGKVRSSTGVPLVGANVVASTNQFAGSGQTDADGNFRIGSDLGAGTYTVIATYDSGQAVQQNIKVIQGQETKGVDFTLTVAPSGSISGRITEMDGSPVAYASVTAMGPTGSGTTQTDANGNYVISKGLGTGTYTVSVDAAGYASKNVTNVGAVVGQVTRNVNLKLTKIPSGQSGKISGIVEGEPGSTIVRQPSTISCQASASSVEIGGQLTILGTISPARVGSTVTVSYASAGSWKTLGTAASGLGGSYSFTWTPSSPGSYHIRASWEGDTSYFSASSSNVSITVTGKSPSPTSTPSPTPSPSPTSSPTPPPKSGCLIATATYGSELSPQVQFLRGFRDNLALQTFAGSSFMAVFNTFYYSFSPSVASIISENQQLRQTMKIGLYPLIGALEVSYGAYQLLRFSPELAIVAAGLVASTLIGLFYFAPAVLAVCVARRLRPPKKLLLASSLVWVGSAIAIVIAELSASYSLMMASTSAIVLATIFAITLAMGEVAHRLCSC